MAKKARRKRKILSISEVRLRCGGFRGFITGFRDVGDKGRFEISFFGLGLTPFVCFVVGLLDGIVCDEDVLDIGCAGATGCLRMTTMVPVK